MRCRGTTATYGDRCMNEATRGTYCHLHAPGSRHIPTQVREDVFDASMGACHYCGKQLTFGNRSAGRGVWEPDHLRPHSQGGNNTAANLVAACRACNRERSDSAVRDFGGGERRCEGFRADGTRCTFRVAPGNYKYCGHH
jgi:5-methylcytosine-specific restriction endonuclease McrA